MPRRINPKCLACAQLSATDARQLHGPSGDHCWHEQRCPRRRSHYRHRRENNTRRRTEYHQARVQPETEQIAVPLSLPAVAYLYLYREKRQDAPLHAIAATVWQGNRKVLELEPIHCAGLRNRQLNQYLKEVLTQLEQRYGITQFEAQIRLEPQECPIDPCPLKISSDTTGVEL